MAVRPNPPQHAPAPVSPQGSGGLALVPAGAHQGKPSLPLTRTFTLIGSRNRAHLHLVSPSVSKSHTAVVVTSTGLYVRDLASRTHTIVNGKPETEAALKHGDKLTVGNFQFRISAKALVGKKPGKAAPKASVVVDGAEFPIPVEGRSLLIGRRPTCDVPLMEESVSTVHALIFEVDGAHYVRDLGSRTGTLVNGKPVHQHPLSFGDTLRVGDTTMRYAPEGGELEQPAEAIDEVDAAPAVTAAAAIAPPPVPDWAEGRAAEAADDLTVSEEADAHLPVAPAAEHSAPASEADDLDLIPLAEDEPADTAPVGNWNRVREPAPTARPAESELEPLDLEPAAERPVVDEVEAEADLLPVEPAAEAETPAEEVPAEPAMEAVGEPSASSHDAGAVGRDADADDDLGLDFAEPVEAEAETAKADAEEEPGDLDLSGLSLEPVAGDEPTAAAPVVESGEPEPVAESPAPVEVPTFDLDVAESLPPALDDAPAAAAVVDEPAAPAGKKARKKPAAKKEKPAKEKPGAPAAPAKKEKQSWWGRKRKQQQPDVAAAETPASDEPAAPLSPAAGLAGAGLAGAGLAGAGAAAATPAGPDAISGDDLSFLDDILAADAAADATRPAPSDDLDLTSLSAEAPTPVDPSLDFSDAALDAPQASDAGTIEFAGRGNAPADSLAGLDFSNLATGSGLDLGGVVDAVDLPEAGAAEVVPPPRKPAADFDEIELASEVAESPAAAGDAFDLPEPETAVAADDAAGEVLDFPEAATTGATLDLSLADDEEAPDAAASPTPLLAEGEGEGDATTLSDTTFGRAVEAMGDPDLAPVEEPPVENAASADAEDTSVAAAEAVEVEAADEPVGEGLVEAEESTEPAVAVTPAAAVTEPAEDASLPVAETEAAAEPVEETPAVAAETQADGLDALVAESLPQSARGEQDPAAVVDAEESSALAFDDMLDEVLGTPEAEAAEPKFNFELGAAPAAPRTAGESLAISFEGDGEEQYETQADKLIAAAASADEKGGAAEVAPADDAPLDEVFGEAVEPSADEHSPAPVAEAAADEVVSDELSADTLAVAEPDPESGVDATPVVVDLEDPDGESAAPPLIADLTSPTEDVNVLDDAASEPADLAGAEAAEAIEFDLGPEAEEGALPESVAAVEEEAIDFDALAPDASAELPATTGEALEEGVAPVPGEEPAAAFEETPDATDEAAGVTAPAVPSSEIDEPKINPFDPFMGMGRDSGTFIGGMPLSLPPLDAAAAAAPLRPSPPPRPAASAQPAADDAVDDADIEAIDFTTEPADDAAAAEVPPVVPVVPAPAAAPMADASKGRSVPKPPPAARNIPPRGGPQQQPPAGGRRAAFGPFDLGLGDGAVEIPPFNRTAPGQAPTAGPLTTAFDGLALDDDEENIDAFSALGSGRSADPIFGGLPSRRPAAAPPAPPEARNPAPPAAPPAAPVAVPEEPAADDAPTDDDDLTPPTDGGGGGQVDTVAEPPTVPSDDGLDEALAELPPSSAEAEFPPLDLDEPAPVPARAAAKPPAVGGRRPPGYTPPPAEVATNPNPPPAPAKKRRWGVRFLLPLMFFCAGLAVAAVYVLQPKLYPRTVEVSGYLEFDGLDKLTEGQRLAERDRQRELLRGLQQQAREVLIGTDEGVDPGFLDAGSDQDARAFAAIVDSVKVQDRSSKLALYHHGFDRDGDPARMRALLTALRTKNASLGDEAVSSAAGLAKAKADLDVLLREIDGLKLRIEAGQQFDEGRLASLDLKVNELKANDERLSKELSRAKQLVKDMEADLERAIAANNPDAREGGAGASAKRGAAGGADPAEDSQLKEMSRRLADLTDALERAKGVRSAESTDAATKLNEALTRFDKEIAVAQSGLKGDDQLAGYLEGAQGVQRTIRNMFERMAARQGVWTERLNKRKARLGELLEARIKEAWSGDAQLKGLQETLSIREHHRNAAAASGLNDQVARLDKDIAALNAQIDARRELVGAPIATAADVLEQQDFIDQSLKDLRTEREEDGKSMAVVFENFQRQAPVIENLPAEQQRLAHALAQRSAELNAAREQYLKASASESSNDTQAIEAEVAQTQAKIDARKRQLADAAAQDLTTQQRQEREFRIAQARTNLEDAKVALNRAESARDASYKELDDAERAAASARTTFVQSKADQAKLARLDRQRAEKVALVDRLDQELKGKISPRELDRYAVTTTLGEDTRPIVSLIAAVLVFGFFSLLMFVTAHQPPAGLTDEGVPFAAATYADEFSEPAPRFADIDAAAARAAAINGNGHAFDATPEDAPRVAV